MKRLMAILLLMILAIPAASAAQEVCYIDGQTADRVHLRAQAGANADSLGLFFTGTKVTVLDWLDGWARVKIGDVTGYMMNSFLTAEAVAQAGPWYLVDNPSSTWANLRSAPSMTGDVLLCPDNGTAVRILGETADGWSYAECQGRVGYLRTSLLSPMEDSTSRQRTTILAQEDWGTYIHEYIAPNGKPIYFTAELREPDITLEDVNFDGWDDIAVMTISGATNAFYEFFVYEPDTDEYVRVFHAGEEALANYRLIPALGLVETYGKSGYAGMLHEICLYRWEGNELKLVRSALSEELEVTEYTQSTFVTTMYTDILHLTVRDATGGEGTILLDKSYAMDGLDYDAFFAEEEAALWQGLK